MTGGIAGRARQDTGAAAVEFALVLPLLLIVLFGMIDAGRVLDSQLIIDRSAAYGARLAALGRDGVAALVQSAAAGAGPVTVTVQGCPAGFIQVADASVTVSGLLDLSLPGLPGWHLSVTSTAVQPCEP